MDLGSAGAVSRARRRSRIGCSTCGGATVRAGATSDFTVTFNDVSFPQTVQPGRTYSVAIDGDLERDRFFAHGPSSGDNCSIVPPDIPGNRAGMDIRVNLFIGGEQVATDDTCQASGAAFTPNAFTMDLEFNAPEEPGVYDLELVAEGDGTGTTMGTFTSTIEVPDDGETRPIVDLFPSEITTQKAGGEIEVTASWFIENGNLDQGWQVNGTVAVEVDGERVRSADWGVFLDALTGELFEESWTLPADAGDEVAVRVTMNSPENRVRILTADLPRPNIAIANVESEGFRDGGQGFVDVLFDVETSEAGDFDVGGEVIVTAGNRNIAQDGWTGTTSRSSAAQFSRTFAVDAEDDDVDVEIEVAMTDPITDVSRTSATVPGSEGPPPDPCPNGILIPDPRGGQACVPLLALAAAAGGGLLLVVLLAGLGGDDDGGGIPTPTGVASEAAEQAARGAVEQASSELRNVRQGSQSGR